MSNLKYVGRTPDGDSSILPKSYVDTTYATLKVDNVYVDSQIVVYTPAMVTPAYVDAEDALRAHKTDVDTADLNYVATTQRAVANGVASIGSDGYIPSAQLPTVISDRVPVFVNGSITMVAPHTCTHTTTKEFQAGSMTISDPGYPYRPLVFAVFQGGGTGDTTPVDRWTGTGTYGKVVVLGPSDAVYAAGLSTGNFRNSFCYALPYAIGSQTPSSVTGSLTLDLWLSLWSSAGDPGGYTFTTTGIQFFAMVFPAI